MLTRWLAGLFGPELCDAEWNDGAHGARKDGFPLSLGRVRVTRSARIALEAACVNVRDLLENHATGDFGDVTQDEKAANVAAVADGGMVTSLYPIPGSGGCIVVNTEGSRTSTVVCLAEEF